MESTKLARGAGALRGSRTLALVVAAALVTPAAAAAARPAPAQPPSPPAGVPPAATSPVLAPASAPVRSAPAAPSLAPSPSLAAAPAIAEPGGAAWRVGPGLGFELGMGDDEYSTVKIRIDAERELRRLSPFTTLSFVASVSASHPSGTEDVSVVPPGGFALERAKLEWDANVLEVIPAARIVYAATPKVSLYGDGGLGVVYTAARTYVPPAASVLGASDLADDGVGAVLRLAGGLFYAPTPALRVGVEAMGLHLRFGDGPGTAIDLLVSISHQL